MITSGIHGLVSEEVLKAAQNTLARNRVIAKNTPRHYLLKSVIRCGICGLTYVACPGRSFHWYRCNGKLTDRGPIQGRCQSKAIKGPDLDSVVWEDVQRFLLDPGDIMDELSHEREANAGQAIAEAERVTLESALASLAQRRKKAIELNIRETISDAELDELLAQVDRERGGIEERLSGLERASEEPGPAPNPDLLEELRRRLDEGLDDAQRQEVARLLVKKITVHTELGPEGKKKQSVPVEYRFPAVVSTSTGMGS